MTFGLVTRSQLPSLWILMRAFSGKPRGAPLSWSASWRMSANERSAPANNNSAAGALRYAPPRINGASECALPSASTQSKSGSLEYSRIFLPGKRLLELQRRESHRANGAVLLRHLAFLRADMRAFFTGQALGISTQGHDDASLDVEPAVVVDAESLVLDAIAHEYQRRLEVELGLARAQAHQDVVAVLEAALARRSADHQRAAIPAARGLLQRHLLEPAALGSTRVETIGLEFAGHVARGDFVAARAGVAAFEQVVREEGHVRAKSLG